MADALYGASQAEWDALSRLNLPDLLPYIADPTLPIHPGSSLKPGQMGKVPSRWYSNAKGEGVGGILKWSSPDKVTTSVTDWASDPRHSAGMRMHRIKAFDIDVPDAELSAQIVEVLTEELGVMPHRYREGTGKCALLFRLRDNPRMKKDVIPLGDSTRGAIEILSQDQFMCMAGGYTKGGRYLWKDGVPDNLLDVPEIEVDDLIRVRRRLIKEFGRSNWDVPLQIGDHYIERSRIVDRFAEDPLVQYVQEKGHFVQYGTNGGVYVSCPWDHYHESETKATDAELFVKGTNDTKHYGFKCLHAHSRAPTGFTQPTHIDYMMAIGYKDVEVQSEFEILDIETPSERPQFTYGGRSQAILPEIGNVVAMLQWSEGSGYHVIYDEFRDAILYRKMTDLSWTNLKDTSYTEIRIHLSKVGIPMVGLDIIKEAVHYVASLNTINTAQQWLSGIQWDGVPRLDNLNHALFGLSDDYSRAVLRYLWTAMAGRAMSPGLKADMVPIFIGDQGLRKSSLIEAMAPDPAQFAKIKMDGRDADLSRQLRGKLIVEWDEMRGLNSRDAESIKSWVSQTKDEWIPKFKEFATTTQRQFLVCGTSNTDRILNDPTGARRWLPIHLQDFINVDYMIAHRHQLWAEARTIFVKDGVQWEDAERLAKAMHHDHTVRDPWVDLLSEFFDYNDNGWYETWNGTMLMTRALSLTPANVNVANQSRLQRTMTFMGFKEDKRGNFYRELA